MDKQKAKELLKLQIQKERGNDYSAESHPINYEFKEITESITRIY